MIPRVQVSAKSGSHPPQIEKIGDGRCWARAGRKKRRPNGLLRHACCRPVVHCRTPSICAITGRQWDQVTKQLYFSQDGTENNKISFARFSIYLRTWLCQTLAACQRPQSWNCRCATCTFPETLAVKLAKLPLNCKHGGERRARIQRR